jgi:5-hydroxyisourate hydrolase-like protein (transthyretin family)
MKSNLVFAVLILFLTVSFVSAEITITEPLETYNLGDTIPLTVTLTPASNSGWFEVKLVCDDEEIVLEKTIGSNFVIDEEQKRNIKIPLTPDYLGAITGNCNVVAALGSEQVITKNFQISDSMTLNVKLDKENYNPGEAITLTIESIKDNGLPLNGFVEVSGAKEISKTISDGETKEIFTMPETAEAGKYELNIFAYDKISGEILNKKNKTIGFNINQIPTSMVISLSSQDIKPGKELTYSIDLYDQSGVEVKKSISVNLVSPNGKEQQIVTSTEDIETISLEKNATAGKWILSATAGDLYEEKEINVLENAQIEMELVGPLLRITNVGNTNYDKVINVKIGDENRQLDLDIKAGEERTFNLKAPEGEYDITINSGENQISGKAFLTGNAVAVQGKSGLNILNRYPIIWIFLIILLGALAVTVYFKSRTKTHKLKPSSVKTKKIKLPKITSFRRKADSSRILTNSKEKKESVRDFTEHKEAKQGAESSLVMSGDKEIASILAIKISNLSKLGQDAKKLLQEELPTLTIIKY